MLKVSQSSLPRRRLQIVPAFEAVSRLRLVGLKTSFGFKCYHLLSWNCQSIYFHSLLFRHYVVGSAHSVTDWQLRKINTRETCDVASILFLLVRQYRTFGEETELSLLLVTFRTFQCQPLTAWKYSLQLQLKLREVFNCLCDVVQWALQCWRHWPCFLTDRRWSWQLHLLYLCWHHFFASWFVPLLWQRHAWHWVWNSSQATHFVVS